MLDARLISTRLRSRFSGFPYRTCSVWRRQGTPSLPYFSPLLRRVGFRLRHTSSASLRRPAAICLPVSAHRALCNIRFSSGTASSADLVTLLFLFSLSTFSPFCLFFFSSTLPHCAFSVSLMACAHGSRHAHHH